MCVCRNMHLVIKIYSKCLKFFYKTIKMQDTLPLIPSKCFSSLQHTYPIFLATVWFIIAVMTAIMIVQKRASKTVSESGKNGRICIQIEEECLEEDNCQCLLL